MTNLTGIYKLQYFIAIVVMFRCDGWVLPKSNIAAVVFYPTMAGNKFSIYMFLHILRKTKTETEIKHYGWCIPSNDVRE